MSVIQKLGGVVTVLGVAPLVVASLRTVLLHKLGVGGEEDREAFDHIYVTTDGGLPVAANHVKHVRSSILM